MNSIVLILIYLTSGLYPNTYSIEFTSLENCEASSKIIQKAYDNSGVNKTYKTLILNECRRK
jgi:hypothetical protein